MAIVFVDVYQSCNLPIGEGSEVVLCLASNWADRTLNGLAIGYGTVTAKTTVYSNQTVYPEYQLACSPPELPACPPPQSCVPHHHHHSSCCDPCYDPCKPTCHPPHHSVHSHYHHSHSVANSQRYYRCRYRIEIDTTQFLIDPSTQTNWVPTCNDILDIMPYWCTISQLIAGQGINTDNTDSITLTYTPSPTNQLEADLNIDTVTGGNLSSVNANGLYTSLGVWQDWSPTYVPSGSMTYDETTNIAKYLDAGPIVFFVLESEGTLGGTASPTIKFSLPTVPSFGGYACSARIFDQGGSWEVGSGLVSQEDLGNVYISTYDESDFALGADATLQVSGFYIK